MKGALRRALGRRIYQSLNAALRTYKEEGREENREVSKNKVFKNMHQGESCFIIGNGPSLSRMDLSPLNKCHTFGLNKIFMLFEKVDLQISYYVAVNPLVIQQSAKEIERLSCPSFLALDAARGVVRRRDHIYYLKTGAVWMFQKDMQGLVCEGTTVAYVAMQIAFYMGFRKVYLIGVDHNYTVRGKPNKEQLLSEDDMNHFDPRYFKNQRWNLPDMEGNELSYGIAKYIYGYDGREILDATLDGRLNIFPKVSYDEALSRCQL
jgi:hypothetical protein